MAGYCHRFCDNFFRCVVPCVKFTATMLERYVTSNILNLVWEQAYPAGISLIRRRFVCLVSLVFSSFKRYARLHICKIESVYPLNTRCGNL